MKKILIILLSILLTNLTYAADENTNLDLKLYSLLRFF